MINLRSHSYASVIRAGALASFAGAGILVLMAVVGFSAGDQLAQMGTPDAFAGMLPAAARAVTIVMALDNLFVIAYTAAFTAAAVLVWERARFFGVVGLGYMLLTGVLDLIENALTVYLGRAALFGDAIPPGQLAALSLLEQVKYASAAVGMGALAIALLIALPGNRLGQFLGAAFFLFGAVNALAVYNPPFGLLRVLLMLVMLGLAGALLWREAAEQT